MRRRRNRSGCRLHCSTMRRVLLLPCYCYRHQRFSPRRRRYQQYHPDPSLPRPPSPASPPPLPPPPCPPPARPPWRRRRGRIGAPPPPWPCTAASAASTRCPPLPPPPPLAAPAAHALCRTRGGGAPGERTWGPRMFAVAARRRAVGTTASGRGGAPSWGSGGCAGPGCGGGCRLPCDCWPRCGAAPLAPDGTPGGDLRFFLFLGAGGGREE